MKITALIIIGVFFCLVAVSIIWILCAASSLDRDLEDEEQIRYLDEYSKGRKNSNEGTNTDN